MVKVVDEATAPEGRESQATKLVRLFLNQQPEPLLFHDERQVPYARLQASPARILRLGTKESKTMLGGLLWDAEEKAPGSEAVASAMNVLHHRALKGPTLPLHNRLAWHEGAIWMDLTDEGWRAVKISSKGWTIESRPPTLFRRYAQQLPVAEPLRGGDPWKLLSYFSVREEDRLLLMVYVASLFVPDFPHPVLDIHGAQGATKTTLMVLLKELLDPSAVGVCSLPRSERELVQILDHSYLPYFDNVSSLPDWMSDAFCRAITGMGFSKRQLYTDDEDVVYWLMRPVGINGINVAAQRPDLLDRSLLIGLDQMPDDRRRKIVDIKAEFSRDAPSILGGFLDTLVKALNLPEPKLQRVSRMADFESWGYRLAQALGKTGEEFIAAYAENIRGQAEEAVRADIVAEVFVGFLDSQSDQRWQGTSTELLGLLREKAEALHVSTRQRAWPKSSNALSRRLHVLRDPLRRIGYAVDFIRDADEKRTRLISVALEAGKASQLPSKPSISSRLSTIGRTADDVDDGDNSCGTFPSVQEPRQETQPLHERNERGLAKASLHDARQAAIDFLSDYRNLDADGWAPLDKFTEAVGGPDMVQLMLRDGLIMTDPSAFNKVRLLRR